MLASGATDILHARTQAGNHDRGSEEEGEKVAKRGLHELHAESNDNSLSLHAWDGQIEEESGVKT
jgi:hypothetical protein